MFKVTFSFEDGSVVEHFANAGDNLLELAREANVAIDAPCSGNASCGKCRVQLKKGELDSKKTLHISEEEYQEGWRLACTSKICADVTVLVPDIASAYKSRMKVADLSSKEEIAIFENSKRDVEMTGIELRNSLDVIELDMNEPSLDDTMPDNERLTRALKKYMNLKQVRIPYAVLRKLPDVLRENHFKVKCVVRTAPNDLFVYDIFGKDEEVVGLKSHIKHMKETLEQTEGIGRKLDFIAQEMNREANTILSKTNDLAISDIGISLKTDIEKVREQIQNIE